ncbi:hypothetical protein ONV78_17300 [Hahella sp. CR1]|uniref:hypothetical protein n=1 Tax=Hahella sp. CR1 TaxID=2992807 RepID=UPI002441DB00|nr:hypothetical protein [Hahella sp. CR1]MDG9669500.1 hypothetical protein [Hahella sp. CR1]
MGNVILVDEFWHKIGVQCSRQDAVSCINAKLNLLRGIESASVLSPTTLNRVRVCENWLENLKRCWLENKTLADDCADCVIFHSIATQELVTLEKMLKQALTLSTLSESS